MDSFSYLRKNTLLAAKGGCICTPLTPPKSATVHGHENVETSVNYVWPILSYLRSVDI